MNYINSMPYVVICVLLIYIVYLRKQNKVLKNIEKKRDEYIEQLEVFGNDMNYYACRFFDKIQIILDMLCTDGTYLNSVGSMRCDRCDIQNTYNHKGTRTTKSTAQIEVAYELVNSTINKLEEARENKK